MCINTSEWIPPPHNLLYRAKKSKVRVHRLRLTRRNRRLNLNRGGGVGLFVKAEIEVKNLKLYMENRNIIEENEKLRKKALLLHQENQALMSQLQKKFSNLHGFSDLLHMCH